MTVLVTGGAGYIGAHIVDALLGRGDQVVVVDDLSAGLRSRIMDVPFELIDLTATGAVTQLAEIMRDHGVRAMIHLAARKQVAESVARPNWYYAQNVGGLVVVLAAARETGVARVVFSSTAAVYGESSTPVTELSPTAPANPYGETKLAGEWLLRDETLAQGMRGISLRYFNVAGAARPELGDTAESNIVPMVFGRIARGLGPQIFGDDYDTPDGTCVRDYVHVADVARAHLDALDALDDPATSYRVYNLGTGRGSSVREMAEMMSEIAGSTTPSVVEPRRAGDPAVVVADASRISAELGWTPRHDLRETLTSAWLARPMMPRGRAEEPG